MPNLYRLKISLLEPHRPISALHRIIDVRGDLAFDELKQVIGHYFDFDNEFAWQFVIARQKLDNFGKLQTCKEFVSAKAMPDLKDDELLHKATVNFDELQLALKDYVYLWLMPDDKDEVDLVFRIRIERIAKASDGIANAHLIKSLGEMPIKPKNKKSDTDFEMSLISALMLIATGGDGTPVRWQELVDNGVADELVKRDLIKPCVNPSHKVKMTAYGESELARVMKALGIV